MSDAEIERTSPPELANLEAVWGQVANEPPAPTKRAISLRVDEDVLAWFKQTSDRYQTTMNEVLRAYMTVASRMHVHEERKAEAPATGATAPTRRGARRHTA